MATTTQKTKQIHELYLECKKVFEPSIELINEAVNMKDGEEFEFYSMLVQFFGHEKQQALIDRGIF